MSTYYISRDNNNALINMGSGTFRVTCTAQSILYVVPDGTAMGDCATAAVGTYLIGSTQSVVEIPKTYKVCVISAHRDVWVYASPVPSQTPEPPPPEPIQCKIWTYKDDNLSFSKTMNGHTFFNKFQVGHYQWYLKGYTQRTEAETPIKILTRYGGLETWATNFAVPSNTSPNVNSAWRGAEIEINYQFFMPDPVEYFRFELWPYPILKPLSWLKRLD